MNTIKSKTLEPGEYRKRKPKKSRKMRKTSRKRSPIYKSPLKTMYNKVVKSRSPTYKSPLKAKYQYPLFNTPLNPYQFM